MPPGDAIARGLAGAPIELIDEVTSEYRVYIRDADYVEIDELEDWLSLKLVKKFNAVGTWFLEISADSVSAPLIDRTCGIIVRRNNVAIFSGSIATEYTITATTIRMAGFDDNALLKVAALPKTDGPPYTTEFDVRTGLASSVMIQYVQFNRSLNARPNRIIPQLLLSANPLLGATITWRARWNPLVEMLAEIAVLPASGGLRFEILQADSPPGPASTLYFTVTEPQDKTDDVVFGIEEQTISDFEDTYLRPTANKVFLLLGDELGSDRSVIEVEDAASIAQDGLIEAVVDARDVTDPTEALDRAAATLAGAVSSRRITVTPFQIRTLEPVDDYWLGDIVTTVVNGVAEPRVVREIEFDFSADRNVVVTPMIGDPNASNDDHDARQIAAVMGRVGHLEQVWNVPDDGLTRAMLKPVLKPPIGEVAWLAHTTVPSGWLSANGQAVSRTTYADLFALLSTTWGAGNGTTTFNVPDLRNRSPIGSGSSYTLGQLLGAATVNIEHLHTGPAHTHPGSHSHTTPAHDHTGPAHTHPGSHAHSLNNHQHGIGTHQHNTDINHDHPATNSGPALAFAAALSTFPGAVTNVDHRHAVDIPALGTSSQTSSTPSAVPVDAASGNTGTDSSAPAASFSANTGTAAPTTNTDSSAPAASAANTGLAGSTALSVVHPSAGLLPVIYSGV